MRFWGIVFLAWACGGGDKVKVERLAGLPGEKGEQGDRGEQGLPGETCEFAETNGARIITCGESGMVIPRPKLKVCLCTGPHLVLTNLLTLSELNEMDLDPPFVLHTGRCRVEADEGVEYSLEINVDANKNHPTYSICR